MHSATYDLAVVAAAHFAAVALAALELERRQLGRRSCCAHVRLHVGD